MVIGMVGWIPTPTPIPQQSPAQLATVFAPGPLPRLPTAYEKGWTGEHCQYIYTEETVLNWPPIPEFQPQHNPGGNTDGI